MIITILGAGYVGLPLAISFAKYYKVICFDVNKSRIANLQNGKDINKQHLKKEFIKKNLTFTSDSNLIRNKEMYIVTVPTPVKLNKNPDLSMLKKACIIIGKSLKKKSCIVFESTTYPGCTEEICIPIIEKYSKLNYNKDFFIAYSPERVNPGDKINTLKSITKIVGADNFKTLNKVKKLYKQICKFIYPVSSIKIAEAAKVIENVQRDVNIALVNEFSIIFNKLDIPTNETLKAAATKWNFHYYKPGLVGGHCIGVDPYYLSYKAKQKNYSTNLILSGRVFNENMAKYIANKSLKLLFDNKINFSTARVAILGFSFKENIPDFRNTKVMQIIQKLRRSNVKVKVFDPIVSRSEVKKEHKIHIYDFFELKRFKFDIIVLAVSHKLFLKKIDYYSKFYKNANKKIFVDIKNNYRADDLKKNNFKFFQL